MKKLKRIHLFELEDFPWFPNWLRDCMTRYINLMHRMLGTEKDLAELIGHGLQHTSENRIVDFCSGSGGPMPQVAERVRMEYNAPDLILQLSDFYPNLKLARAINDREDAHFIYIEHIVNVLEMDEWFKGVRTLVCSFHHFKPENAQRILKNAVVANEPICVYEISDNSYPKWLWWLSIPFVIIMVLLLTPFIRPLSWQQLVFTYLIPILPLAIAWDGAVSNARTYTLDDLEILLEGVPSENYLWEKGIFNGKGGNKLYLLGLPKKVNQA